MGTTTNHNNRDPISANVISVCVCVPNTIQIGIQRKQVALVSNVIRIAVTSLPSARRVQTAAEANVQGTEAATMIPIERSPRSNLDNKIARQGTNTMLIADQSQAGQGLRIDCHATRVSTVNAIMNMTNVTITCRKRLQLANASSNVGASIPIESTATNDIKNHCFLRKSIVIQGSPLIRSTSIPPIEYLEVRLE